VKAIHRGMTLREFEAAFRAIGGEIEDVRRSGERRYSHPVLGDRHCTANARRRDASRALVGYGLQAARALCVVPR
jgi:hypothetical protein